jgi:cyclase
MLATRVIPTLLCRGRQLVKGKQFNSWRSVGLAAQAVRIHQQRGVDELILLDIAATPEGRGPDLDLIRELSDILFCPLTVGGGVRSIDDVHALMEAGADKVAIKTAAYKDPSLVRKIADRFGSQAIVVAIDHDYQGDPYQSPWQEAQWFERQGAGELLLTSVEREGTMHGYDLEEINAVTVNVGIPVIAHGGCSGYEDMHNAIQAGASAVAAGALFQFTDCTPRGAAEYLKSRGVEVRL